ncbi:hypothetical protein [Falsiroseomonas oryzae]|uniref:hypothetical protein n=1 Tax=Falsiroseomonas oryzae TaxID=2766473 RepID=UPI0022EA4751|nr:hypothetical protein [Roseomonas sp. MO-31]
MPNVISFNSITLTTRERLFLGPPAFKKLQVIRIGELRAYWPDDVPKDASGDMPRLRAMSADVEELHIGVLTILRGGLNIVEIKQIQVHNASSDGLGMRIKHIDQLHIERYFNDDDDDGAVTVDAKGDIRVKYVDQMDVTNFYNSAVTATDLVLVLPRHVEPTRKWAPVQVTKRPKLTAG